MRRGTPALLTVLRGMLRRTEGRGAEGALPAQDFQPDWERLVGDAHRHGLSAVLAGELPHLGLAPPPQQAARLAADARRVVARGLQARALLRRALEALGEEGVVPVLLKGHGLALRLYPNPLARPLSDVDLLVAPGELPRAERALMGLGLTRHVDVGQADVYEDHHHVAFTGAEGTVELHFRALSGFGDASLEYAHVAPRLRTGEVEGLPVRFLGPEDELVYLSAHAATHVFLRLGWLLDVALLLQRSPALDWVRVEETSEVARVHHAFRVAGTALGVALQVHLPAEAPGGGRAGAARVRLVEALLTEEQLVSTRLAGARVRSFLLRALMADRLPATGRHVLEGALRGGRRAVLSRLRGRRAA